MTPPWGSGGHRWHTTGPAVRTASPAEARPQQHVVTLPRVAASVPLARRTAQMTLVSFGLAPGASLLDAALLVTTELVTNSVRHANAAAHLDLVLGLGGDELTIAVHDEDPALPPWPPTTRYGAARHGLAVLADLAAGHGGRIDLQPDFAAPGKTVRVALPRTQ